MNNFPLYWQNKNKYSEKKILVFCCSDFFEGLFASEAGYRRILGGNIRTKITQPFDTRPSAKRRSSKPKFFQNFYDSAFKPITIWREGQLVGVVKKEPRPFSVFD